VVCFFLLGRQCLHPDHLLFFPHHPSSVHREVSIFPPEGPPSLLVPCNPRPVSSTLEILYNPAFFLGADDPKKPMDPLDPGSTDPQKPITLVY